MYKLSALLSGLIFGLGLIISGMTDPAKVLGFLDLAGLWDPSLGLVMAGAIGVSFFGFRHAKQRHTSYCDTPIHLPTGNKLDRRLVAGSVIFGAGWGIAGICPGPALVMLGTGMAEALIFATAMLTGMWLFRLWQVR